MISPSSGRADTARRRTVGGTRAIGLIRGAGAGVLVLCALLSAPAVAQDPDVTQITPLALPLNEDVAQATRFARLNNDVIYVESATGPIPMQRQITPPEPSTGPAAIDPVAIQGSRLILVAIGLALAVLLWMNRDALRARLHRAPGGATAARPRARTETADIWTLEDATADARLTALAAMADREEALRLLISDVLHAAAHQSNLRLSRAETARDLLSRLPTGFTHEADLVRLVQTEELVQFGGRGLTETEFGDCLSRAARLLGVRAPQPQGGV